MKLKEIKPGMVIHCKTQEEADSLCEYLCASQQWKDYWSVHLSDTCYEINILSADTPIYCFGTAKSFVGKCIIEFSDLIMPDLTAEEVIEWFRDYFISNEFIEVFGDDYSVSGLTSTFSPSEIVSKIAQWKSDHEKKEPEIETVDICRIIEIQPDGRKRCVYEEDMEMGPDFPTGEEWIEVEKILKRYCMEHDGEFIAVHEVVSRVKAVK